MGQSEDHSGHADWLNRIAVKSKRPVEEVKGAMEALGVRPRPTLAIPKRLRIQRLEFEGEKKGKHRGRFHFDQECEPGLWAIVTDKNLAGKTTILNLIRWCLTGHRPDAIMSEWFDQIELRFSLDGQSFEVEVNAPRDSAGQLMLVKDSKRTVLQAFRSGQEFEATMSEFFMSGLGLQKIVNHTVQRGKGLDVAHDWPWLSGAMWIDHDPKVTFGSVPVSGMPLRMMQMYLGLPWANTVNEVKAAESRIEHDQSQHKAALARTGSSRRARISELQETLDDLREKLANAPESEDLVARLGSANAAFAASEDKARAASHSLAVAEDDLNSAKDALQEARRALHSWKENEAAGFVFRALRPECCPACDEVFTREREGRLQEQRLCLVCATPEQEGDDASGREVELEAAVRDAASVVDAQARRRDLLANEVESARRLMSKFEEECALISAKLQAPSERHDLKVAIWKAEAKVEELSREAEADSTSDANSTSILKAAEEVTKEIMRPGQEAILARVSQLTCEYAIRFGMTSLESVKITNGAAMQLRKDGEATSFYKQTAGERVRLKIAATLAMLKIAEDEGVGRHPGLLLVDSPGANEIVPSDYDELISGLADLADEFPHIQVFVTAINTDVIQRRVPCEHLVQSKGDDPLW